MSILFRGLVGLVVSATALIVVIPTDAIAQEAPRFSVAAGYTFLHDFDFVDENLPTGWFAAVTTRIHGPLTTTRCLRSPVARQSVISRACQFTPPEATQ